MKILHTISQLPSKTGSGIYLKNLIEKLDENHVNGLIYASQDGFDTDLVKEENKFPVYFKEGDLDFPIAGMSDEMPYESTVFSKMTESQLDDYIRVFTLKLREAVESFKPDLIISNHLWIFTSIVKKEYPQIKQLAICHSTGLRQAMKCPAIKEKYLTSLDEIDRVYALSENQKEEIKEIHNLGDEKISILGGAYDENRFYPDNSKKTGPIKLVYAGKLARAKGVYELTDVIREIQNENMDTEVFFYGAKSLEQKLEIEGLLKGVDRVSVSFALKQEELADVFRTCDLFLLPSYYEGLGLSVIEALACGMRAVTSQIRGLRQLLGQDFMERRLLDMVDLPRLRDTDKPYPEDLPIFKNALKLAIDRKLQEIRKSRFIDEGSLDIIKTHTWTNLVKRLEKDLEEL